MYDITDFSDTAIVEMLDDMDDDPRDTNTDMTLIVIAGDSLAHMDGDAPEDFTERRRVANRKRMAALTA